MLWIMQPLCNHLMPVTYLAKCFMFVLQQMCFGVFCIWRRLIQAKQVMSWGHKVPHVIQTIWSQLMNLVVELQNNSTETQSPLTLTFNL